MKCPCNSKRLRQIPQGNEVDLNLASRTSLPLADEKYASSLHKFHVKQWWLIAVCVAGYYAIATHIELSEKLAGLTAHYEHWQLDELPLTLLLLSVSLCVLAYRRTQDARRELAHRIHAQAHACELLRQNRDLSRRLTQIQESERRALARELHDEFGQNCTALRAEASYILHATVDDKVHASARCIAVAAETLSAIVRELLQRLRPPMLDALGLESALQELCERWEEQTGIACGLLTHPADAKFDESTSIAIFRLVQEALTNVTRHACATQVRIILHKGADLKLNIQDDGRGMINPEDSHPGFGLLGMRERVAALQGKITFSSLPGSGLHIAVELPLNLED